jgi:hypothetical protein
VHSWFSWILVWYSSCWWLYTSFRSSRIGDFWTHCCSLSFSTFAYSSFSLLLFEERLVTWNFFIEFAVYTWCREQDSTEIAVHQYEKYLLLGFQIYYWISKCTRCHQYTNIIKMD